jgi:hypothetical protein
MSVASILDVIAYVETQAEITLNEVAVLTAIANYANRKGRAYPSLKTLQRYARIAVRTIQYALRRLEARSAIKTIIEPGHRTPSYQLLIPHVDRPKFIHALHAPSPIYRPKFTYAPHAPGGALHAPNPIIEPEERKNAREIYRTGARDNTPAVTWDPEDLESKARKFITPGSPLWPLMTATAKAPEGFHDEDCTARRSPVVWHQNGRGVSGFLLTSEDGRYQAFITRSAPHRLLHAWEMHIT